MGLGETIVNAEVYIIYKKEGDLMCYRITEVRNGKNVLDHLDLNIGLFCAIHLHAFSRFLLKVTRDFFVHF